MTRSLRHRHRIVVIALMVILPTAFALGIATRKETRTSTVPAPGFLLERRNQTELWSRDDLWQKNSIRTRLLALGSGAGELAIELVATARIVRPDVLVYWVPGNREIHGSLPGDAFLLGNFDNLKSALLVLPVFNMKEAGVLVLYSLADQEVINTSRSFLIR